MVVLAYLFITYIIVLLPDLSIGKKYFKHETRIVGGKDATNNQFPFIVSIAISIGGNQFVVCGGTIIDPLWIITAAHCLIDAHVGSDYEKIHIYTGSNTFATGRDHSVESTHIHEKYSSSDYTADVALIKLKNTITNEHIKKIPLEKSEIPNNTKSLIIGWGKTAKGNAKRVENNSKLRYVNVQTVPCKSSSETTQHIFMFVITVIKQQGPADDSSVICTSTENGKGACKGDSGGPLIANGKLIGIVSSGIPCASGSPDVYTKVSKYIDWINQVINKN